MVRKPRRARTDARDLVPVIRAAQQARRFPGEQRAQQERAPHYEDPLDFPSSGSFFLVRAEDIDIPAEALRKSGTLAFFRASSVGLTAEFLQRARRAASENEDRAAYRMDYLAFLEGAILHGRKEVAQPAEVVTAQRAVDLVPERISMGGVRRGPRPGPVKGLNERVWRAELGQIESPGLVIVRLKTGQ